MKTLSIISLLLFSLNAIGQLNSFVKQTDSIALRIEAEDGKVERFRWLLGYIEYKIVRNELAKIVYSYKAGPRQIFQTFYLQNSTLIFTTKQATSYYLYGDNSKLLTKDYFVNNSLKYHFVSDGEETEDIRQVEQDVLVKYAESQNNIRWHIRKKKGG